MKTYNCRKNLVSETPNEYENDGGNQYQIPHDVIYQNDDMEESEVDETNIAFEEHEFIEFESSSSEDESDSLSLKESSVDDPPIYVIPPSSDLFQSYITKSEHTLALSAFSTRHNLSDAAVKDLLKLVQLHLPQNNIAETSIKELKEKCGFDEKYINCRLYCNACKKVYTNETDACQTPGCVGSKTDSNSCKYFITSDLKVQIKEILERRGIWEAIEASKSVKATDTINDVTSGLGYKKLQKDGQFLHNNCNITLTMFTDGVPLFKSSSISLWPVYLLINEIPAKERFLRKNMLLWGVWQGNGKPKMNMFLHPLVIDLLELANIGVSVTSNNKSFTVKAMLIVATMDLQARAYVTNMTQHNGENGCLYCEESGVVVTSGKGQCRSYPHRSVPAKRRSEVEMKEYATRAQESGKRIKGFFGISILSYLPYFSLIENMVIDYMHGTLLGITKKFLHLWLDPVYKTQPYYIGHHISSMDKILKKIKPPYMIHRMPRILSNTFIHWKASELRNWLLFYSLPCLQGYLPDIYFHHFSCLVEATYLMLSEGISKEDLRRADVLYRHFVEQSGNIYGQQLLSLNMHNLTHTVDCVKMWGPLWAWSCFSFESFNGEIKRGIHGTGNVCRQIFWAFQAQKRIVQTMNSYNTIKEGTFKMFMEEMLDSSDKRKIGQEAHKCKVVKPQEITTLFDDNLKTQLDQMIQFSTESDFLNVSKIIRHGFIMYCSSCSKVKKQNSFSIAFEQKSTDDIIGMEVNHFLLHKDTRHVFAVGKMLAAKGNIIDRRVPHLQKLELR